MYHDWIAMYPWLQYVVAFIIIMFFLFLRKVFTRYVFAFILRLSRKSKSELLPNILLSFQRPVRFFFVILGLYLAIQYLVPDDPTAAVERRMEVVNTFFRSSVILMFGWGFFNVSGTSSNLFKKLSMRLDSGEDSMLVPFLSKLLRVLIVALTVVVILDTFGFDINGFVAGLGLGGLAFALAAQDTIGNLFGGIIIVTEKPFKKDDWIETPTVEGIVEDISFRSTKVRTFSEGSLQCPTQHSLTNRSRIGLR